MSQIEKAYQCLTLWHKWITFSQIDSLKKVKKLWPGTDQNYVKNMPKYAMAPGAEANWTHYGIQIFFFQISLKIIDRNQKPML